MVLFFVTQLIMSPNIIELVDKYVCNIVIFLLEVKYGYKRSVVGYLRTQ